MKASQFTAALPVANQFISFVNEACTPFHATDLVSSELLAKGYIKLSAKTLWPELKPGQKAFFTRNDSSIVAFRVGGKYTAGNGLKIMGTHTDSPNFSLKPKTYKKKGAFLGVGVQCYGGGLWHTWFDRELTVAGRVIVEDPNTKLLQSKLVRVKDPILCLPTLAIHLRSAAEREGFGPNKETHLMPLIASQLAADAFAVGGDGDNKCPPTAASTGKADQCPLLMKALAEELKCNPDDILDFDLSVIDAQPAGLCGYHKELIMAPRIDNLLSCFCALRAMLDVDDATYEADKMITVVAMFDNEEVGSSSSQGAGGTMVTELMEYITNNDPKVKITTIANSFLLSVDGAHAAHPNYLDKHEEDHRPLFHAGPVIKYNANVRYATTGATAGKLRAIAKLAGVPMQQFCVKNDSPCGSTIGPILSTLCGIQAVDLGNAMLSMHSIRETCGTVDTMFMIQLLTAFIARFDEVPLEEVKTC